MKDPRVSGFAFPMMILFILSACAILPGLVMLGNGNPRMGVLFCVFGLAGSFVFGCIYHNLTMTEEEGRIIPPPAGRENNCVDDPELDRC